MTRKQQPIMLGKLIPPHISTSQTTATRFKTSIQNVYSPNKPQHDRTVSTQASQTTLAVQDGVTPDTVGTANPPISKIARRNQANKEFFTSLLGSAATKRDAKAYISRLKSPSKVKAVQPAAQDHRPRVNLGGLFRTTRAVEESPVFTQYELEEKRFEELETLHVALVKLGNIDKIPDKTLVGICETLSQLARLDMLPCVVLELSQSNDAASRSQLKRHAERLSSAINMMSSGSRIVEDIFTVDNTGNLHLALKLLLVKPLRRGLIPIIVPSAYSETSQKLIAAPADDAILALARTFAESQQDPADPVESLTRQVLLDRVITIDEAGGVPSSLAADGMHVFLNLEQEYDAVCQDLKSSSNKNSPQLLRNLKMLRCALQILPPTASALMATTQEAANILPPQEELDPSSVGTRRQKNTLIHNLLTDKPSYSSSLPKGRLGKKDSSSRVPQVSTFIKHGMPLTILPNPWTQPWTPDGPRIQLTDPEIDLDRLVHLIDDSFNRKLDIKHYLQRVNDRIAGIIIAGEYEGGAILTWETPPGVSPTDTNRLVPYLDKFAVLKKSQGAGGVADILFNAMVRTCFPDGVCWRSRKNNPVNKWYFERSRGTKKISDMNWTMFWTTPGVAEDRARFLDYEGVCRGIEPNWLDKKLAAD